MYLTCGVKVFFSCKSCTGTFQKLDEYLKHKQQSHLLEFRKNKCIIFEERNIPNLTEEQHEQDNNQYGPLVPLGLKEETHRTNNSLEYNNGHKNSKSKLVSESMKNEAGSSQNEDNESDAVPLNFLELNWESPNRNFPTSRFSAELHHPNPTPGHANTHPHPHPHLHPHPHPHHPLPAHGNPHPLPHLTYANRSNNAPHFNSVDTDADGDFDFDNVHSSNNNRFGSGEVGPKSTAVAAPVPTSSLRNGMNNLFSHENSELRQINMDAVNELLDPSQQNQNQNQNQNPYVFNKRLSPEELSETSRKSPPQLQPQRPWSRDSNSNTETTTTTEQQLQCKLCLQKFSSSTELRNHIGLCSQSSLSDQRHSFCPLCNKTFSTPHSLKVHNLKIHATQEEKAKFCFKCQLCPKMFVRNTELRIHTESHKRIEEQIRPFKCHLCDMSFVAKHYLTKHLITHSGETPFACPQPNCKKAFKLKGNLKQHISVAHSVSEPIDCPYSGCSKTFKHQYYLNTHLRTHSRSAYGPGPTGNRQYKCTQDNCTKSFVASTDLARHIKLVHKQR